MVRLLLFDLNEVLIGCCVCPTEKMFAQAFPRALVALALPELHLQRDLTEFRCVDVIR
jgi:hypothetical protein